jgi:hypothetical protein
MCPGNVDEIQSIFSTCDFRSFHITENNESSLLPHLPLDKMWKTSCENALNNKQNKSLLGLFPREQVWKRM